MYLQTFTQNNDNQRIVSASGHVVLTWSVGPAAWLCQSALRVQRLQHLQCKSHEHLPGCEIIFPTAVLDPQYELICIQPIRDDFFFSSPEPMI